jgi:serine/threonine protein kinase
LTNLIGQTVSHYHILERLGEGGMAEVYKAIDLNLDREVAIKFLRTDPKNFEKSRKRFEIEAKALAKLDHPNIVRVLDYGDYQGRPYLVMEYIPSGNLKQHLGKPMPWKQACSIIIPIAKALQYAHDHHILHRDVKPSNILMKADGTPMLTDFGVAKMLEMDETIDFTGTNVVVGTPAYMPPEIWDGKEWTQASDLYSLVCVFFEILTGRMLFDGDTPSQLMRQHVIEGPRLPKRWPKGVPKEIRHVFIKALSANPEDRFPSGGALLDAIVNAKQWKDTTTKEERPRKKLKESDHQPASKIWQRLPIWVMWGLIVILLILVVSQRMGSNLGNAIVSLIITHTSTPTATPTSTATPTITFTPTGTFTPTITSTPTITMTITPTPTATLIPKYYFTIINNSDDRVSLYIQKGRCGSGGPRAYSLIVGRKSQKAYSLTEGTYYVSIDVMHLSYYSCLTLNLIKNTVWEVNNKGYILQ